MHRARYMTWVCVAMLACAASGCGFHLRSYELDSAVESFALSGETRSRIAAPLRRALGQAGVAELPVSDAALVIDLLDQRSERRSASVGGQARATEYEMSYGVRFRVLANGVEIARPQWLERQRVYRIDRNNIVGSSEEQAIVEREMLQDLVSQMVRIVDTVSRNAESQSARQSSSVSPSASPAVVMGGRLVAIDRVALDRAS